MLTKKHTILIAIVLIVSIFSIGCTNKISEDIGNKVGEKIVEKTTGNKIQMDREEGTINIESEDIKVQSGENLSWPSDRLDNLPRPKGKVNSVGEISEDNVIMVTIDFTDEDIEAIDYIKDDYLKEIEEAEYIEDSLDESDIMFMYTAYKKENNIKLDLQYSPMFDNLTVMYWKGNDNAKDYFEDN